MKVTLYLVSIHTRHQFHDLLGPLQCAPHKAALKTTKELQFAVGTATQLCDRQCHEVNTPELQVGFCCFWVQFKVLMLTYKILYGLFSGLYSPIRIKPILFHVSWMKLLLVLHVWKVK